MTTDDHDTTQARIDSAPLPSARELRRRHNLAVQFLRFLVLNLRMYKLAKGHDSAVKDHS